MPVLKAEVVKNHQDMAVGLMGRHHLPKNAGMLFDFGVDQPLAFWMKNTYIPLQIAFIDSHRVVKHIASMAPLSPRSTRSPSDCRYALEVNEGWFDEHNVRVGATVAVPGGNDTQTDQVKPNDRQEQKEEQQQVSPDVVIEQSYKDIISAANDHGLMIVIEYITKEGNALPPKMISPPFVFGVTADGDHNGLVTVWDEQSGHYASFLVDNITAIKDTKGNPIPNADTVATLSGAIPNKKIDEMSARGKLPQTVE